MSQRQTSVAERHHFIDLKLKGHSLKEIAEQTGWSFYCVRHWKRCYRDGGRGGIDPPDEWKQRGGYMSTYPVSCGLLSCGSRKNIPNGAPP